MKLKALTATLLAAIAATLLPACHPIEEYADDPMGNFRALWDAVDRHYCFFAEKDVDWDAVGIRYARQVELAGPDITRRQLFAICSDMLDELRDGHTNLSAGFATSYYRGWWSDYPENYSERLIQQSYFGFNYSQVGAWTYGILPQNVGYIHISSFSSGLGHGNINSVLTGMLTCTGLVIDVRNNGGGDLSAVETLVSHFLTRPTTVGYMIHKTGPGHNDFSEPFELVYNPVADPAVIWGKPVVVLTNRSTYSAANHFATVMTALPQVTHMGSTTGGGSGMPYSMELPCGWGLRMSAVSVLDCHGVSTDAGLSPAPEFTTDLNPEAALAGHDTMLDAAITHLLSQP